MYDTAFASHDFECDAQEDIKVARMFAFSMIAGIVMWALFIWGVFF
ncbi:MULTISPECIES: hypothetical protein [Thalassobacter]|nr:MULTISPECIES: hypothetical protein [Thalassobacter]